MSLLKILTIFLTIYKVRSWGWTEWTQIPEKYRNAKDIDEHPHWQDVLHKDYPQLFSDVTLKKQKPCNGANNDAVKDPSVIGGIAAIRGQFPFHVLIYIFYDDDIVYMCGGSIIRRNWILTAAHCVSYDFKYLHIHMGLVNVRGPGTWSTKITKQNVITHESFDVDHLYHDIALINLPKLPKNLFNTVFIQTIPLPKCLTGNYFVGKNTTVTGFGRESDEPGTSSKVLKFVRLEVMSNAECKKYFYPGAILMSNLCTKTSINASTCGGDSGGPLTANIDDEKVLIGIVSFGSAVSCKMGYPAGFIRITSYMDWIEQYISTSPKVMEINTILILISLSIVMFVMI